MNILIKNGTLLDPSRGIHEPRSLYVSEGRIIEPRADFTPELTIDAAGLTVCPGFIDIHMHEDPVEDDGIYSDPVRSGAARLLRMGVTTGLGGNCGENSCEPLKYLEMLSREGCFINLALLAGHSYFRDSLSSAGCYGALTEDEAQSVASALEKAVSGGCFGVSFGLEYYPGVTAEELQLCAEACKRAGGRLIAAHIRSCAEKACEAASEILEVGAAAGISVELSHVGSMAAYGDMAAFLAQMDSYSKAGLEVYGDCYPYTAFSTYIGTAPYDDLEAIHCRYEDIIMCEGEYKGLRCTEEIFKKERLEHPDYLTIGEVMNADEVLLALKHPNIMLCSDLTLNHGSGHPRSSGSFPRLLSRYVGPEALSLEEAVYKMTALPARRLGLKGKGSLAPGCDADIVILDPERIADRADFTNPLLDPEGIEYVLVNGNVALCSGDNEIHAFGRVLRRQ